MQSQPPSQPPPPPPMPPHLGHQTAVIENGGYNPERSQSPLLMCWLSLAHNLTQLCLGGVILSSLTIAIVFAYLSESLANHIFLCTIGFFFMMTQAILSISPFGWAANLKHGNKRTIHMTMQILGSAMVVIGSVLQMADSDYESFSSGHGICGFIAMILAVVNLVGGLRCAYWQQSDNVMKILHSCAGAMVLCFAFISLILATHFYSRYVVGDGNANFAIVLTVFALMGTLQAAIVKNIKRIQDK